MPFSCPASTWWPILTTVPGRRSLLNPTRSTKSSDIAFAHHQSGRLQQAEQAYQQILQVEPRHADALHLLGLVFHQLSRHDAAIERISRAIELKPKSVVYLTNLAVVYQAAGRFDQAVATCQRVLRIKPDHAKARPCFYFITTWVNDRRIRWGVPHIISHFN